jgi:hypothetical protein
LITGITRRSVQGRDLTLQNILPDDFTIHPTEKQLMEMGYKRVEFDAKTPF